VIVIFSLKIRFSRVAENNAMREPEMGKRKVGHWDLIFGISINGRKRKNTISKKGIF
jgi:hypothetical protein